MSKLALGLIETIGLAAAIEAGDTAVKSANIKLIGYELSKGGGMVTVKIEGDVGAVKAAVDAGCMAAAKVSKVWSKKVIPRPHEEIEKLIITKETVGIEDNKENEIIEESQTEDFSEEGKAPEQDELEEIDIAQEEEENQEDEDIIEEEIVEKEEDIVEEDDEEEILEDSEEDVIDKEPEEICNLCADPKCPRQKGDLRKDCIHYFEE